jgi:catechol 2,3-dioxygenase-like lactoylglutathione lyase family enzyme
MTVRAKGLDHVAIVVRDLEESIPLWRDVLGLELTHGGVPERQVKTAIFGRGWGGWSSSAPPRLTPVSRSSGVLGEGLHHVHEVEDIQSAMDLTRKAGAPLIDRGPVPARGARAPFVHPKGMRGVPDRAPPGPAEGGAVVREGSPRPLGAAHRSCWLFRRVLSGKTGRAPPGLLSCSQRGCRRSTAVHPAHAWFGDSQSFCTAATEQASAYWEIAAQPR